MCIGGAGVKLCDVSGLRDRRWVKRGAGGAGVTEETNAPTGAAHGRAESLGVEAYWRLTSKLTDPCWAASSWHHTVIWLSLAAVTPICVV